MKATEEHLNKALSLLKWRMEKAQALMEDVQHAVRDFLTDENLVKEYNKYLKQHDKNELLKRQQHYLEKIASINTDGSYAIIKEAKKTMAYAEVHDYFEGYLEAYSDLLAYEFMVATLKTPAFPVLFSGKEKSELLRHEENQLIEAAISATPDHFSIHPEGNQQAAPITIAFRGNNDPLEALTNFFEEVKKWAKESAGAFESAVVAEKLKEYEKKKRANERDVMPHDTEYLLPALLMVVPIGVFKEQSSLRKNWEEKQLKKCIQPMNAIKDMFEHFHNGGSVPMEKILQEYQACIKMVVMIAIGAAKTCRVYNQMVKCLEDPNAQENINISLLINALEVQKKYTAMLDRPLPHFKIEEVKKYTVMLDPKIGEVLSSDRAEGAFAEEVALFEQRKQDTEKAFYGLSAKITVLMQRMQNRLPTLRDELSLNSTSVGEYVLQKIFPDNGQKYAEHLRVHAADREIMSVINVTTFKAFTEANASFLAYEMMLYTYAEMDSLNIINQLRTISRTNAPKFFGHTDKMNQSLNDGISYQKGVEGLLLTLSKKCDPLFDDSRLSERDIGNWVKIHAKHMPDFNKWQKEALSKIVLTYNEIEKTVTDFEHGKISAKKAMEHLVVQEFHLAKVISSTMLDIGVMWITSGKIAEFFKTQSKETDAKAPQILRDLLSKELMVLRGEKPGQGCSIM